MVLLRACLVCFDKQFFLVAIFVWINQLFLLLNLGYQFRYCVFLAASFRLVAWYFLRQLCDFIIFAFNQLVEFLDCFFKLAGCIVNNILLFGDNTFLFFYFLILDPKLVLIEIKFVFVFLLSLKLWSWTGACSSTSNLYLFTIINCTLDWSLRRAVFTFFNGNWFLRSNVWTLAKIRRQLPRCRCLAICTAVFFKLLLTKQVVFVLFTHFW